MEPLPLARQLVLNAFINNASKKKVEDIAIGLKRYAGHKSFIDPTNPLSGDPVLTAKKHLDTSDPLVLTSDQLSSYLAASTLLDCFDAWNYISAAANQLIVGNTSLSVHLAYYAELRATKSFLASEGIGNFSTNNLSITSRGIIEHFKERTHSFIWHALETWVKQPKSGTSLLDSFSFYGKTFTEWVIFADSRVTPLEAQSLIKPWLKRWSVDLDVFGEDHDSRNSVSYQSGSVKDFAPAFDFSSVLDFVSDSWESVMPSAVDSFSLVDQYLLRLLFKDLQVYLKKKYKTGGGTVPSLKELVTSATDSIGGVPSNVYDFLVSNNKSLSDLSLLQEAAKSIKVPFHYSDSPLPIFSRAILMLRISTGVTMNLLKNASITALDIDFWVQIICNDLGYIDGRMSSPLSELTADVSYSIEFIREWIRENQGSITVNTFNTQMPNEARILSQMQRIGLWNLV